MLNRIDLFQPHTNFNETMNNFHIQVFDWNWPIWLCKHCCWSFNKYENEHFHIKPLYMHKISLAWSVMYKIVAQVQQVHVVNKCLLWLDLIFVHVIITFNQILNIRVQENNNKYFNCIHLILILFKCITMLF